MGGERFKDFGKVVFLGAAVTGVVVLGTSAECGDSNNDKQTPDVPTPIVGKLTNTPSFELPTIINTRVASQTLTPVETPIPYLDPGLAAQIKNACTPGIDLPRMSEIELANQKVTRENAVQFLSTGGVDFRLKVELPLPDPNQDKPTNLITCYILLQEGTRNVGIDLEVVDPQGKKKTINSYDMLIDVLTHGGSDRIPDNAARALPFFNQDTFPYIVQEVDGEKPIDAMGLKFVRLLRASGSVCEEAIYAIQVAPDPTGRQKVGEIIDQGRAPDGACKTQ